VSSFSGEHYISTTASYWNIEKAKKKKKSWYQYVFSMRLRRNEATEESQGQERLAQTGPIMKATLLLNHVVLPEFDFSDKRVNRELD